MTVSMSAGLLILRLVAGLTIAAHGAQKLFGWFGGPGVSKLMRGFQGQGLKPGWFWVSLAILGEFGGGLSVAFGFFYSPGSRRVIRRDVYGHFQGPLEERFLEQQTRRGVSADAAGYGYGDWLYRPR